MKSLTTLQEAKNAIKNNQKVMIKFFSPMCGHCNAIKGYYLKLGKKYPKVHFCEVNVMEYDDLSKEYGVFAVPTFLYFENMKSGGTVMGADKEKIIGLLE